LTPQEPGPPQQQDYPQIPRADSFPQPMEPPAANTNVNSAVILPARQEGLPHEVTVFDPSMLDQQPVPRVQGRPQYPFEMRRLGLGGTVVVDFIVDSNGEVRNASALRSTNGGFESSAVAAVAKWKFKAGRKNGHAVATHMQVPIGFVLDTN
jgi:periplasmic protein TonB